MNINNSPIKILLIALVIFVFNIALWYLPIKYKGTAAVPVDQNLLLARNLHLSGKYAVESDRGVILSSQKVAAEGIINQTGNKLTPQIYSRIYDLVGYHPKLPQYISLVAFALANVLLFLFLTSQFGLVIGLIFSITSIFTPVIWRGSLRPGFYEWAVLFFTLGFIFYWLKKRSSLFFLFLAGIFFSLAILARNAFLIVVMAIGFFELINKKSLKRLVVFGLPICVIFLIPFTMSYFQRGTFYVDQNSFAIYGHCFPDPYTFNFMKDEYAHSEIFPARGDVLECLKSYGYESDVGSHLLNFFVSIKFYLRELFRLIFFGGPIVWLVVILGWFKLKEKKLELRQMFVIWLSFLFLFLIYFRTSNWDHFLEIWLPIIILASFGFHYLIDILSENINFLTTKKSRTIFVIIFCLLFVGHLVTADQWMFHEDYSTSRIEEIQQYAKSINRTELNNDDIIALDSDKIVEINYFVDKNLVKFSQSTIKKLLEAGQLKDAFEKYHVTHIIGYDLDLSQDIMERAGVQAILLQ